MGSIALSLHTLYLSRASRYSIACSTRAASVFKLVAMQSSRLRASVSSIRGATPAARAWRRAYVACCFGWPWRRRKHGGACGSGHVYQHRHLAAGMGLPRPRGGASRLCCCTALDAGLLLPACCLCSLNSTYIFAGGKMKIGIRKCYLSRVQLFSSPLAGRNLLPYQTCEECCKIVENVVGIDGGSAGGSFGEYRLADHIGDAQRDRRGGRMSCSIMAHLRAPRIAPRLNGGDNTHAPRSSSRRHAYRRAGVDAEK